VRLNKPQTRCDPGTLVLPPAPGVPESSPCATAKGLWDNLVGMHHAYTSRIDGGPLCVEESSGGVHFYAGAGFYFVKPHFESNPAFSSSLTLTAAGVTTVTGTTKEFDYSAEFAPRLSLGVVGAGGLGARAGWWHFDQGPSVPLQASNTDSTLSTTVSSAPVAGVPDFTSPGAVARAFGVFNDQMTFNTHLKLDVWDWEVTQVLEPAGWSLLVAGGLRYAYLSQDYEADRVNQGSGRSGTSRVTVTTDADFIRAGHNFSGVGPTAALEARRPLGDTAFSLYSSARGALLFGRSRSQAFQRTREVRTVTPTRGLASTVNTTTVTGNNDSRDDLLPVGDLELGAEWARDTGRIRFFVRTGFVGQVWFGAGNATSENGNLGFLGLTLMAGALY
jgi:hypothetical protein